MRRKNTKTERAKNLKMDSDVYTLRQNVMKTVYEASRIAGYKLPRVEIRIVENSREFIGLARLSDCVVWVTERIAKTNDLAGRLLKRSLPSPLSFSNSQPPQ